MDDRMIGKESDALLYVLFVVCVRDMICYKMKVDMVMAEIFYEQHACVLHS